MDNKIFTIPIFNKKYAKIQFSSIFAEHLVLGQIAGRKFFPRAFWLRFEKKDRQAQLPANLDLSFFC